MILGSLRRVYSTVSLDSIFKFSIFISPVTTTDRYRQVIHLIGVRTVILVFRKSGKEEMGVHRPGDVGASSVS